MDVEPHTNDLSIQQAETMDQFKEITGVVNLPRARDILRRHDWQIEKAVNDQLNLKDGRPSVFSKESDVPNLRVELNSDKLKVFNAETAGTDSYLSFVIDYVLKTFYDKVVSSVSFYWRSIWSKRQCLIIESVTDVINFISYFELNYGDSHPTFYKGSYNQALNDAKRELLFLVVYLHKRNRSDCSNFCSSLTNDRIISFMNEGNILFWACDLDTNEGSRVATALHASNVHPCVSVVLVIDGTMTQVAQMNGFVSIQEFLNGLQTIILVNQPNILLERVERVEKHYSTVIRDWYVSKRLMSKSHMKRKISDEEKQEEDEYLQDQTGKKMIEKQELEKMQDLEERIQNQTFEEEMVQEENLNNKNGGLSVEIQDEPSIE